MASSPSSRSRRAVWASTEWSFTDDEVLAALDEAAVDFLKSGPTITTDGEVIDAGMAPAKMIAACMWSGDPWGESAHEEYEAKLINRLLRLRDQGVLEWRWQRNIEGGILGGGDERHRLYGRAG